MRLGSFLFKYNHRKCVDVLFHLFRVSRLSKIKNDISSGVLQRPLFLLIMGFNKSFILYFNTTTTTTKTIIITTTIKTTTTTTTTTIIIIK